MNDQEYFDEAGKEMAKNGRILSTLLRGRVDDDILALKYNIAREKYIHGDYEGAVEDSLYLIMSDLSNEKYYTLFSLCLYEKGIYEKAINIFLYSLSINNYNPIALYGLSKCLVKIGKYEEARETIQIAIQQSNEWPEKWMAVNILSHELIDSLH